MEYYIEIVNYPNGIEGFAEVESYKNYGENLKEAEEDFNKLSSSENKIIHLYQYDEGLDMNTLINGK